MQIPEQGVKSFEEEYSTKLEGHKIPSNLIKNIIMEYLVVEGFSESAKEFKQEANIDCKLFIIGDPDQRQIVEGRTQVRTAIQEGNMKLAISALNEIDPCILDQNPELFFSLKKQQLIEMIKSNKLEEALKFAQAELSQKAKYHKQFLGELESVMSLMAFEDYSQEAENQLSFAHRQALASKANQAIMKSQSLNTDSQLPMYLKVMLWQEEQLSTAGVKFGKVKNLVNMEFKESS